MTMRRRKGVILLQTLVMSVVLSFMAVMVLQWVLGRYMLAARAYKGAKSFSHSEGYSDMFSSTWNFGSTPGNGSATVETQPISYEINLQPNGMFYKVDYKSDEELAN